MVSAKCRRSGHEAQLSGNGRTGAPAQLHKHTEYLLAQFGSQCNRAVATYIERVRAGVGLPSMWDALQDQPYLGYLGDAAFTDKARQTVSNRLLNDPEIPRLQRRARVAPLAVFAATPERNNAIVKTYATGRYSQKKIATAFDIHYATVSRIVKVNAPLLGAQ